MGDEATEWLRPASAARLLDLPRSSMSDMMHGRAQVREPLVVKHLPNGQARISRASVLAQLAGVMIALAVEQSSGAIVSPALLPPARMGSATGEVLAIGAGLGHPCRIAGEWGGFAGSVGDMPTGQSPSCAGSGDSSPISPVISPVVDLDPLGFNQGGRGSERAGRADRRMDSAEQNNFALARLSGSAEEVTDMTTRDTSAGNSAPEKKEEAEAKAALRSASADKRKCPVCLLSVCPAAWVQCFGEDDCPRHWELLKKEGAAA